MSEDGTILASTMPEALEDRIGTLIDQGGQPHDVQVGRRALPRARARASRPSTGIMHVIAARNDETTACSSTA